MYLELKKRHSLEMYVLPSDFFLHPSTPTVPFIWQGSRNMITSSWSPFGITKYDHMILLILPSLNSRNIITWSCSLFGIRKHDHIILLLLTSLNSEIWSLDLFSFLDLEIWSHDPVLFRGSWNMINGPAPSACPFIRFQKYDEWLDSILFVGFRNKITWSYSFCLH